VLPAIDPSVATGAITVLGMLVKGYFEDRKHKRRYASLSAKIDENTNVNVEQIKVSNHINEKIASTNVVAADGLTLLRGEVGELTTKVDFYTDVTQELSTVVRDNTRRLDAVIVGRAAGGD
jgi:hypothetical protein